MENKSIFGQLWASVMFITAGFLFLINEFFTTVQWKHIWPLLLIITGILIIYEAINFKKNK